MLLPQFLGLEIPQDSHLLTEREFINPLSVIIDSGFTAENRSHKIEVGSETIERIFQNTKSHSEKTRTWSIVSLFSLWKLGVLSENRAKEFGELIWADGYRGGLPEHRGFHKFAFLDLPIPEGIDARGKFKKYLLETSLPIIGDTHKGVSLAGGNFPIIADLLGSAKCIEWTRLGDSRTLG